MLTVILLAGLAGCSSKLAGADSAAAAGGGSAQQSGDLELGLVFDGPAPTNVLMISWDTTRPDHLGWFSDSQDTPTLDDLFGKSVVLENHRSCSDWTYASVVCFQTGMRDVEAGFIPSLSDINESAPDSLLLASERLSNQGYQTALVSTNNFLSSSHNTAQGFDTVDADQSAGAEWVTDTALERLAALDPSQPWYVHAHYIDPHTPYGPPPLYLDELDALDPIPYDLGTQDGYDAMVADYDRLGSATQALIREHIEVRYRGELRYDDDQLAVLLDGVESMGLLKDTLVVFWSDHGEQMYEHGSSGHASDLYEEENRATVSFWARGIRPVGWVAPTSHPDVWPTILDTLGLGAEGTTGQILGTRPADTVRYGLRYSGSSSVQMVERQDTKLLYSWIDGHTELYALSDDPDERSDRWDPSTPLDEQLWKLLEDDVAQIIQVSGDSTPLR